MPVNISTPKPLAIASEMKKPLGSLRDLLHAHIHRKDQERPPWNLHASDITKEDGFCGRYPILMKLHSNPEDKNYPYIPLPSKPVTTSMAVTWEWGRLVEARVINWFAEMGLSHGDWQCKHFGCGKTHPWRTKPPACVKCGGKDFQYIEPRAKSAYSGASSGLDMLVRMPDRPLLVFTEIKSIDAEKFKALLAPLSEHRVRTMLSLRNIEESDDPRMKEVDNQVAFTLYVSKGGYGTKTAMVEGGFTPFREFPISRNDAAIDHYAQSARAAHLALKGEGPMPERLCKHHSDGRAQRCPAMAVCWKGIMK